MIINLNKFVKLAELKFYFVYKREDSLLIVIIKETKMQRYS